MPELPEVEITARRLRGALPGRRVAAVHVPDPRVLQTGVVADWQARLTGGVFVGVRRRAKFLLLELENEDRAGGDPEGGHPPRLGASGSERQRWENRSTSSRRRDTVVAHLRMTGKLAVTEEAAARFLRFAAELDGGGFLCFHDPRRLGQLWLASSTPLATLPLTAVEGTLPATLPPTAVQPVVTLPPLARLGPDALEEPSSAERLAELGAGGSRQRGSSGRPPPRPTGGRGGRSIKALLMDQGILGGLGNICAGEILFRVGLSPERPAGTLTAVEWERLATAIPEYLRWAIAAQEEKPLHYLGERDAENPFALYRRAGTPCPRCGAPIRRVVVAGRGTYVCPECQRK